MLKVIAVSDLKTEKTRKDGKVSRKFYTLSLGDANDPFKKKRIKNIFENHVGDGKTEARFSSANQAEAKALIGKTIPGSIQIVEVEPYQVDGSDRMATKFAAVIIGDETLANVLKSAGRVLKGAEAQVAEEATESLN